mmetsp:Transcript_26727/g.41821  ORF Transcript_26727/g.41821 Transcript_26727/m.41821 type:complete len:321 (+) Transcript_26727:173-1135(+)
MVGVKKKAAGAPAGAKPRPKSAGKGGASDAELEQKEYVWEDGARYEGKWLNGKMHGFGMYTEVDGSRYEGQWYEGKMQGRGMQVFAKGDRYDGDYHDGHRHGRGKQTFANGNQYDGEFWQGEIHGKGTYKCADGRVYVGEFKHNKKDGKGKYSGANGSYEGQYLDGKKHGKGAFTFLDGSSYDGEWLDDVMHGRGIRTTPEGVRSHVVYEKGKLSNSMNTLSSSKSTLLPDGPGRSAAVRRNQLSMDNKGGSIGKKTVAKSANTRNLDPPDDGPLQDDYDGAFGGLKKQWDELNEALNCYGAITEARDACAPSSGLGIMA